MPDRSPPTRRVCRIESALVFGVAAAVCLLAGILTLRGGHIHGHLPSLSDTRGSWDALAALSHAYDVVHKEPRFNLTLVGFVDPPLPAIIYIPFAAITPSLATSGMAAPILGCLLLGACALMLNSLAAQARLPAYLRWPLVFAFVLHPLILSLGALGAPGIILAFSLLGSAWALMRWCREQSFRDLLTCSIFLTAAVMTRYEAVWILLATAIYVGWRAFRSHEGWARVEGTLIAFGLPLGYSAAVWIGANWVIMGDPWHFWRETIGEGNGLQISRGDWLTSALWVGLLCCPVLAGVVYHEIRGVGPAPDGRPAAWLIVGAGAGVILSPTLHAALGEDQWSRLLTFAVAATVMGAALVAVVAGQHLGAPRAKPRRPLLGTGLLAALGIAAAIWLHAAYPFALLPTPVDVLAGKPAFSDHVAPERNAASIIRGTLARPYPPPQAGPYVVVPGPGFPMSLFSRAPKQFLAYSAAHAKVYVVGRGPAFAISLFSGLPERFVFPEDPDIAALPLKMHDMLILDRLQDPRFFLTHGAHGHLRLPGDSPQVRALNAMLRKKHLSVSLPPAHGACDERWTVVKLRASPPGKG